MEKLTIVFHEKRIDTRVGIPYEAWVALHPRVLHYTDDAGDRRNLHKATEGVAYTVVTLPPEYEVL